MTVCIAAIYSNTSILGVSDRMLTGGSGDIEFEPPARKIFPLTRCIVVMTAGDSSVQAQLLAKAQEYIKTRIESAPTEWIQVADVAEFYRQAYIDFRKERAEKAVLDPLNLTYASFIAGQKSMSDEFISDVNYKLQNFEIDGEDVASIITGLDELGPHIFVVQNDYLSNFDNVGFAAIGIGGAHARLHLMLSGHSRNTDEAKALLTVHRAKKKSEVSPGVGKATDMFVVSPGPDPTPGTFYMLEPAGEFTTDIVKDLDKFYGGYVRRNTQADKRDESKIREYLANLSTETTTTTQVAPTSDVKTADEVELKDVAEVKITKPEEAGHEKKNRPRAKSRKTN